MKIVLGTNVFVSGVFFGGPPHRILDAWRVGCLTLVVSPEVLDEYRRVGEELAEEFGGIDLSPFLMLLAAHAEVIDAPPLTTPLCRNPDDDMFLACASAEDVPVIVSGDQDLLAVGEFRGVRMLKPREFADRHHSP